MEPLFTKEECQRWKNQSSKQTCCKKPDLIKYLKQDRAIDEMPNLYRQCKNCLRIMRDKKH